MTLCKCNGWFESAGLYKRQGFKLNKLFRDGAPDKETKEDAPKPTQKSTQPEKESVAESPK